MDGSECESVDDTDTEQLPTAHCTKGTTEGVPSCPTKGATKGNSKLFRLAGMQYRSKKVALTSACKALRWTATVLECLFREYHFSSEALGLQRPEITKQPLVKWLERKSLCCLHCSYLCSHFVAISKVCTASCWTSQYYIAKRQI